MANGSTAQNKYGIGTSGAATQYGVRLGGAVPLSLVNQTPTAHRSSYGT